MNSGEDRVNEVGLRGKLVGGRASALSDFLFVGHFDVALDDKNRLTLPVSWRAPFLRTEYPGEPGLFVVPKEDAPQRLLAYPEVWIEQYYGQHLEGRDHDDEEWGKIARWTHAAEFCALDRAGRITLPRRLLDFVGIKPRQRVVVAGVLRRFEIAGVESVPNEWAAHHAEMVGD